MKILVAVDNSPYLTKILNYVVKIFSNNSEADLHFFHIKKPCYIFNDLLTEETDKDILLQKIEQLKRDKKKCKIESEKIVEQIKNQIENKINEIKGDKPKINFEAVEEIDDYAKTILNKAKEIKAETIIVGRKGDSIVSEYLIGSTADKLLRIAKDITIWIVE
jgi:nucleotide-binding universal stress UspA family protein